MSPQELLIRVVQTLDSLGIPYMMTGSIASSVQGEPRSTHDIDVVLELSEESASALVARFPEPDFYVSHEAAVAAVRDRSMFNILDTTSGDKVDCWLLTDTPFDRSRFARRTFVQLLSTAIALSTPEDTILQKLLWSRLAGGSRQQERDARAVYELQRARLDEEYLDLWADRLEIKERLRALRSAAESG